MPRNECEKRNFGGKRYEWSWSAKSDGGVKERYDLTIVRERRNGVGGSHTYIKSFTSHRSIVVGQ